MFYNREIAKEVLGSDDPDAVQAEVKDWAAFKATADKLKDAGYQACSSVNDTFRVYSNNVTSKWVDGNKINIDYFVNDIMDPEDVRDIYNFFKEQDKDDLQAAFDEFGDDISEDEIRLVRIKFISDMAN